MGYSGSDHLTKETLSPLGKDVADLLGDLYLGIYHIPERTLEKVNWGNNQYISIVVRDDDFSTYDFDRLTRLVVLCHDRCLRCEIHGRGFNYLELMFHRRKRDGKELWERHPTIEDAVERCRKAYGIA